MTIASLAPLLTEEEARHNFHVFTKAALNSKASSYRYSPRRTVAEIVVPTSVDIKAPGAEVVDGPQSEASSPLEFYRNPKYHLDVLATFVSTSMGMAKYVPLLTEIAGEASKEAEGFARYLTILGSSFPQYVYFEDASSVYIKNSSASFEPLLRDVLSFIKETSINPEKAGEGLIAMIKSATHAMTSPQTTTYKRSLYTSYSFQGRDRNPKTTMYWSSVNMQRNHVGKTTTVSSEIYVTRFTVQLISGSVIADAEILAQAKGTAAQAVADIINGFNK